MNVAAWHFAEAVCERAANIAEGMPADNRRTRGSTAAGRMIDASEDCSRAARPLARRFILNKEPQEVAERSFTIDYAAALNEAQHAAATAGEGPVLIIAGAGTGKTRTLVYRVAYLIESGFAPENILLLTFTRRAASEMLGRASRLLDGRCERVRGGTFHAVCLEFLRRHAGRIGYPTSFTILDASDSADVIDLIRSQSSAIRSEKRFPKKGTLQAAISASISRDIPLADVIATEYPQFIEHVEAIEGLADRYRVYKRESGLMDYDDLLGLTIELCETNQNAHRQIAGACRHVLVDEYQDTNRLQARLVELFSADHRNITVVGDDAQSIYRFRGADHRNILQFPERFPGTAIHRLRRNYRSTQPILDLANAVLRKASERFEKDLFTEELEGETPALVHCPDSRWQSRFVCQMVLQLREEAVPLHRCAVLFRSGHNAYDLEMELDRQRIPYVKYGGVKLSEAAHIRDVVAHLRVAENPGDVVSWMRILKLIEGVGTKTAQSLIERMAAGEGEALIPIADSARYREGVSSLSGLIRQLRGERAPAAAQVARVLEYYGPILERVYSEDHPRRMQDLEHFATLAEAHASRGALLEALALDPLDLSARDVEATYSDEPPLVLSTIHSAKGLEFDTVFLIDALEGVLPSQYAVRSREELDEELRLLYVALTRAERRLFISYPMTQYRRGAGDYLTRPSRFLDGQPEALLEPWSLEEGSGEEERNLPAAAPPKALPPPRDTADGLPF